MHTSRTFVESLRNPGNAIGDTQIALHDTKLISLAKHRAPAHEYCRGETSDVLLVAQQNISSTSVLFDLGFGWREHFCSSPRPVYVVPSQADARWRLNAESQCIFLGIPGDDVVELLNQFEVTDVSGCLWELASRGFEEVFVHDLITRLWWEMDSGSGNALLCSSYKVAIVHALVRRFATRTRPGRGNTRLGRLQLQRVLEHINADSAEPVSVDSLAALAGLSSYHFMRVFRNTTGRSPYRYYEEVRIEKAKELLASSQIPIAEIGQRVGFACASQFSKSFKRFVGCSPNTYRSGIRR